MLQEVTVLGTDRLALFEMGSVLAAGLRVSGFLCLCFCVYYMVDSWIQSVALC